MVCYCHCYYFHYYSLAARIGSASYRGGRGCLAFADHRFLSCTSMLSPEKKRRDSFTACISPIFSTCKLACCGESLIHSLTYSSTYIHSLTYSSTYTLSLTHPHTLSHLLIHIRSLTYSSTCTHAYAPLIWEFSHASNSRIAFSNLSESPGVAPKSSEPV